MAGTNVGAVWCQRLNTVMQRLFPERQLVLRTEGRISYIKLTKRLQMGVAGLCFGVIAWGTFSSVSVILHDEVLIEKDNQIASARLAYRSLLSEVAEYQKKFTAITGDLEQSHGMMLGLVEENAQLQQHVRSVESRLKQTESERNRIKVARQTMKSELEAIQGRVLEIATHNFSLKDNLADVETNLDSVIAERNQLLLEERRLKNTVATLEERLVALQDTQHEAVQRLTDQTAAFIDSMENVVELTGLDVNHLLLEYDGTLSGQGGPFFEAKPDDLPGGELKAGLTTLDSRLFRSAALRNVMNMLPLASPLDTYYVTSSFGKRRDPVNERWAMHYGTDLGGREKSPVYVTAPGVVKFAGWKGNYGKLIEIDHGAGIVTRYGHLNSILVKAGEKVTFRQKIGLLGSTGRSTGSHLHYEVVFQKKPRNPMKFIKAGRYVFQDEQRHEAATD